MNRLTKILIFSTIFLVPTYLIRFSIFSVPTNLLEILIYFTFISYLFEKPQVNWKELSEKYKIYIFPISLMFSGLILSTLINQNYREGFGIIKGWFFDPLLFSFILINKIDKIGIEKILKTIFFSSAIVSLIALQYFFFGELTYDRRLAAFYSSPNYLAMFLSPSIFIGLYLIRNLKLGIKNYITIFSVFLISFTIYLTHSYAAWIAIVLGFFSVQLIRKRLNWKILTVFILLLAIAITTQMNNPKLKDILSERSSMESRIMIWKSSLKILEDNWIFGIGSGSFQNKYLEYQKYFPLYLDWAVPHPHNLYLAFWLQGGILGFAGFISLLFLWINKVTLTLKKQKNSTLLAVSLGIIFYILIHGIIDTTYWKNDLSLIFWIVIFSATDHLIQDHSKLGQNTLSYWSKKSNRQ